MGEWEEDIVGWRNRREEEKGAGVGREMEKGERRESKGGVEGRKERI